MASLTDAGQPASAKHHRNLTEHGSIRHLHRHPLCATRIVNPLRDTFSPLAKSRVVNLRRNLYFQTFHRSHVIHIAFGPIQPS
jgi:hypothetical protein